MTPNHKGKKAIIVYVTPELHKQLKMRCVLEGISMRHIVSELVTQWLEGKVQNGVTIAEPEIRKEAVH